MEENKSRVKRITRSVERTRRKGWKGKLEFEKKCKDDNV